jgi:tetratricopeptide (TPR) repeat protein
MSDIESPKQSVTPNADQILHQAIAHHQASQLQEAERLYRIILQTQPNHPDANHNLGILAVQVNQVAMGLPHLKAALEADPAQERYWLSYAEALLVAGQVGEALNIIRDAMQRGLNTPAAQALRQKAEMLNNDTRGKAPTSTEIDQLVALFNSARYVEMESRACELIKQYPDSGFAWKALGTSLNEQGKESLFALQKAVELKAEDAEVCKIGRAHV